MNKIETGGPAFPNPYFNNEFGMTLRDYFAAKSMAAELEEGVPENNFTRTARRAYAMGDAMLEARK